MHVVIILQKFEDLFKSQECIFTFLLIILYHLYGERLILEYVVKETQYSTTLACECVKACMHSQR